MISPVDKAVIDEAEARRAKVLADPTLLDNAIPIGAQGRNERAGPAPHPASQGAAVEPHRWIRVGRASLPCEGAVTS